MSEAQDIVIDELEAEPIQTDSKPIEDFLKAIEDQNFTQAERTFNDIVGDRLQDTLDQAKARIAASLGQEPEEASADEYDSEENDDEVELDDEDFDDDDAEK